MLGMNNLIPMSAKELRSFTLTHDVLTGRLTTTEAAARTSVTSRTIRRWVAKVRQGGAKALTHGNRGKPSPRRILESKRQKIQHLVATRYPGFPPTEATERLQEDHGIVHDPTTIRQIMIDGGLWIPRAQRPTHRGVPHRQWRERKARRGELVQFDGSYHDWFEGRGGLGEVCLLAAVDDATGELLGARFVPHEGVLPVMGFWLGYAAIHGLPKSIYLDRLSTYKMHLTVARDNPDLKTQLQRAMGTLGVELIFAHSPQAKGRVERLFGTLQGRLVRAMRLRGIATIEEGNQFLAKTFIPAFNRQFALPPRDPLDVHRPLSKRELAALPEVLCRQEQRRVQPDYTISFRSQWYQIRPTPKLAIRPKDDVLVREYADGALTFFIRHQRLLVNPIPKRLLNTIRRTSPIPILAPELTLRTYS